MGFVGSLLGFVGFGIGISIGLVLGFFIFIYFGNTDHNKVSAHHFIIEFYQSISVIFSKYGQPL